MASTQWHTRAVVIRYFIRGLVSHFRAGRSLFVLTLLGVALGVASVLSIQIINLNALGAFQGSLQAVSGEADLTVVADAPALSEEVYPLVLATPGVKAAWPLIRVEVSLGDRESFYLEVVGVDLFAPVEVPWDGGDRGRPALADISRPLSEDGWVALSPALAEEMNWEVGNRFTVALGSRRVELLIGALVDFQKATPLASRRLAVMDIAQAQAFFGRRGEIDQIDIQIAEGEGRTQVASELRARLGPGVTVVTPEQRQRQATDLLSSFRLNLTALSMISLFVGGFLIFSATQASLVRRRSELGLLRSIGATRRQLLGLILGESLILGLLGVAVGLPLGYGAAATLVERVSTMLSNVYVLQRIETLEMPFWLYPLAAVMGAAGAVAGALLPALDVSRRDTRALLASFTLHERMGRAAGPLSILGCLLMVAAGVLYYWAGEDWRPRGFILAIGLVLIIPLVTPLFVQRGARWVRVRGFGFFYGLKGLGRELQTSPFAVAALAVAVAMMVGITIMVGSFRRTLEVWVDHTLQADIYITSQSWRRGARQATLGPEVVSALTNHPGVAGADRLRQFFVWVGERRVSLSGVDADLPVTEHRFSLLEGQPKEAAQRMWDDGAVLIGEPLARKAGLHVGDELDIQGPRGALSLPIAGIYYDYSSESGSAIMALTTMEKHFGPGFIHNIALYLEPGRDPELVIGELTTRLSEIPLQIRSNRRLREEVFRIFEQTFAVTRLLQVMSLLIAVSGITLTLLVLAREKVPELALYRALGAERYQIFRTYLGKGLGIALSGMVLGGVGGTALAMILIFIINRAFFGWTIALYWPWTTLVGEAVAVLAASVAGSVYPALRASRTPATELRRDDL